MLVIENKYDYYNHYFDDDDDDNDDVDDIEGDHEYDHVVYQVCVPVKKFDSICECLWMCKLLLLVFSYA